ncbi:MAG TPA: type III pantothenate kinase [Verrucomicrobiae bacterium]|jgi:type III pantothenate kinase
MILLLDIGNTNTHIGVANDRRVLRLADVPTREWFGGKAPALVRKFAGAKNIEGAALCSVVPRATPFAQKAIHQFWKVRALELSARMLRGVGIEYPKPGSIGPDRLANAVAAKSRFGAPVVVVDFGTAVTFDVVNAAGNYAGGIIAPGLAAMTDYLHEKTALLPKIKISEPRRVVGKSTQEAMLAGAVHGYRGLVRELIGELKRELRAKRLPVVATGGYAKLIASKMPEISAVEPALTLEGLRLTWQAHIGG